MRKLSKNLKINKLMFFAHLHKVGIFDWFIILYKECLQKNKNKKKFWKTKENPFINKNPIVDPAFHLMRSHSMAKLIFLFVWWKFDF